MVLYSACGHSAASLSTTSVRANAGAVLKQRRTDESMATRRSFIDPPLLLNWSLLGREAQATCRKTGPAGPKTRLMGSAAIAAGDPCCSDLNADYSTPFACRRKSCEALSFCSDPSRCKQKGPRKR